MPPEITRKTALITGGAKRIGREIALTLAADHRELVTRLVVEDTLAHPSRRSLLGRLPLISLVLASVTTPSSHSPSGGRSGPQTR